MTSSPKSNLDKKDFDTILNADYKSQSAHPPTELVNSLQIQSSTKKNANDPVFVREAQQEFTWLQSTFRSTWFQIIIVGALAFCGPAMSDAISNLGGGGMAVPWAVNSANSATYASSAIVCMMGGPLATRIGIRKLLILGAATFPINGSSYYVNLKYKLQWYLVFGRTIGGIGTGLWYIAESTMVLTYPEDNRRGAMLSFWVMSRNLGQIVGGVISLARNFPNIHGPTIATNTFLVFIAIEACGLPISLLISPSEKVRRQDGTSITMSPPLPWREEFKIVWRTFLQPRSLWLSPYFFYSFFYGAVLGTYLTLNFDVRARALSSLLVPIAIVVFVFSFGLLLDYKRWTQPRRAKVAFLVVTIPTAVSFIWLMVNQVDHNKHGHKKLDWTSPGWANAYVPFLIMQISGYQCQTFIYWLISCHSDDINTNARAAGIFRAIEASGQAISYGLNSRVKTNIPPLAINLALFLLSVPGCMVVIAQTPKERIHDQVIQDDLEVDSEHH